MRATSTMSSTYQVGCAPPVASCHTSPEIPVGPPRLASSTSTCVHVPACGRTATLSPAVPPWSYVTRLSRCPPALPPCTQKRTDSSSAVATVGSTWR
ncbi:MAG: hypothetical protein AB2L07_08325 [Thermoanaerobaculaceae bacterium]